MATYQRSQLRDAVRRRADIENSTFITDAELDLMLEDSHIELYQFLVSLNGETHYSTTNTLSTVAGTPNYSVPADEDARPYLRITRVHTVFDGIQVPMRRFQLGDEVLDTTAHAWDRGVDLKYCLIGKEQILFHPEPDAVHVVTFYGVPLPLFAAGDTAEPEFVPPWEEYMIIDCAIKCRVKEESDVAPLMAMKDGMIERIKAWEGPRDAASPQLIRDSRALDELDSHFWLDRFY